MPRVDLQTYSRTLANALYSFINCRYRYNPGLHLPHGHKFFIAIANQEILQTDEVQVFLDIPAGSKHALIPRAGFPH